MIEKIKEFTKKYNIDNTLYGGQCYVESIWVESGELVSKLSTSGSYGAPYYVLGLKTRGDIEKDLINIFIK